MRLITGLLVWIAPSVALAHAGHGISAGHAHMEWIAVGVAVAIGCAVALKSKAK